MTLANAPIGSYAIEAFLKSRSVPSEKKHTLIENLKVRLNVMTVNPSISKRTVSYIVRQTDRQVMRVKRIIN